MNCLLWEVAEQHSDGVFLEVLLEGVGEVDHGLAGAELRALHHALLVEDEQVGAARQHVAALVRLHARGAVLPQVLQEPPNQLGQVSKNRQF